MTHTYPIKPKTAAVYTCLHMCTPYETGTTVPTTTILYTRYTDSRSLVVPAHDYVSPAGLMSAASTLTPKNFAAVTHFRGPGPSLLRYKEGVDGPTDFKGGATEAEEAGGVPAGGGDFAFLGAAFLEAAFLEALSAFFAAFLLGPDAEGAASCSRQMGCEDTSGENGLSLGSGCQPSKM